MALELQELCLSPPGVVPQRYHLLRWICDYNWSGVNPDNLSLASMEAMQFGHSLKRIICTILINNPSRGPLMLNKTYLSDGFYHMDVNQDDAPKLGVVFPTKPGADPMIAVPLFLPMGWKISPLAFSIATKTIADVGNSRLRNPNYTPPPQ